MMRAETASLSRKSEMRVMIPGRKQSRISRPKRLRSEKRRATPEGVLNARQRGKTSSRERLRNNGGM